MHQQAVVGRERAINSCVLGNKIALPASSSPGAVLGIDDVATDSSTRGAMSPASSNRTLGVLGEALERAAVVESAADGPLCPHAVTSEDGLPSTPVFLSAGVDVSSESADSRSPRISCDEIDKPASDGETTAASTPRRSMIPMITNEALDNCHSTIIHLVDESAAAPGAARDHAVIPRSAEEAVVGSLLSQAQRDRQPANDGLGGEMFLPEDVVVGAREISDGGRRSAFSEQSMTPPDLSFRFLPISDAVCRAHAKAHAKTLLEVEAHPHTYSRIWELLARAPLDSWGWAWGGVRKFYGAVTHRKSDDLGDLLIEENFAAFQHLVLEASNHDPHTQNAQDPRARAVGEHLRQSLLNAVLGVDARKKVTWREFVLVMRVLGKLQENSFRCNGSRQRPENIGTPENSLDFVLGKLQETPEEIQDWIQSTKLLGTRLSRPPVAQFFFGRDQLGYRKMHGAEKFVVPKAFSDLLCAKPRTTIPEISRAAGGGGPGGGVITVVG